MPLRFGKITSDKTAISHLGNKVEKFDVGTYCNALQRYIWKHICRGKRIISISGLTALSSFSLALLFSSCASGGRQSSPPAVPVAARSILNVHQVGSIGPEIGALGKLIEPASLLVDNLGDIFIADRAINAIYKLSADLTPLKREGGLGGFGGGFNRPLGMACDAALNLYIADGGNRRIQTLDRNLRFVKSTDSYEDRDGQVVEFNFPSDIAIDNEGNIWVADEDKVLKLDPFYKLIFEASDKGAGYFILGRVSSIEISMAGNVAIGDAGNRRIVIMSTYGNFIADIPTGSASAVTWDDKDNIWAIESDRNRISCYNMTGDLLYTFADMGGSRPIWIAFGRDGELLVLDSNQRRLKTYEIIRGAEAPDKK
ncbi:MAG: hypothetical protein A2W25_07975 [candidate division Zixibacteria bacterium RBG_16_53_22]|nr:MAG: hypothetical protein A2W25_07975 [candidate division Zixibacteria bacterium RBG_16_53_22]